MQYYQTMPHADPPQFEPVADDASHENAAAAAYNNAQFRNFMPAYEQPVTQVNSEHANEGVLEVRHSDGSGTAFYDQSQYQAPRGEHKAYEDARGGQWYAIPGTPAVERKPLYENGKPVYDGDTLRTVQTETLHYKAVSTKIEAPKRRDMQTRKPPRRRQ
jgi:hypothetical protein